MKIKLTKQKTCTTPTLTGWLLITVVIAAGFYAALVNVCPFLSMNKPVHASVLVVEGWVPDYALEKAVHEFNDNHYSLLIVTGGPLENGMPLSEYKTFAQLAGATLKKIGLDSSKIIVLPSPRVLVDRTFTSAGEVKKWVDQSPIPIKSMNLLSMGPHTRRSWLLFQKKLGKNITVGTVCCPDESYNDKKWWVSSPGFRAVTDEFIAYLYARFVFTRC